MNSFIIDSKTYGKFEILVDEDDYHNFLNYSKCIKSCKTKFKQFFYVVIYFNKKHYYLHRLITKCQDKNMVVDHINHNTLDNRKENLRICTKSENVRNQEKSTRNTSSIYKGVWYNKHRKKYIAEIKVNQKKINLGRFLSIKEAAKAYNDAATKYFGKFAYLNKIVD